VSSSTWFVVSRDVAFFALPKPMSSYPFWEERGECVHQPTVLTEMQDSRENRVKMKESRSDQIRGRVPNCSPKLTLS